MIDAWIFDTVRTPIGRHRGALSPVRPDDLAAGVVARVVGHPLDCTGARRVATLARELRRRGGRYGLATMCVGVGQGVAMVIENPEPSR